MKLYDFSQMHPNSYLEYENQSIQQEVQKHVANHDLIKHFYRTYTWFVSQFIKSPAQKSWRPLLDSLKPILI